MSGELRAGSERLDKLKAEAAGYVHIARDDTLQVAEAGESWVVAMLKRHGLDPDEAMQLAQELSDGTVPNLAFMVGERRIDPRAGMVAAVGAGFFNGLGVGLETQSGDNVVVVLDRQVAEDALIGVLEQGERGRRRVHAQRMVLSAIRDELGE